MKNNFSNQIRLLFVTGAESSGKDTQINILKQSMPDAAFIGAGELVRGAKSPDGVYGHFYPLVKPYIETSDSGGILPDEVISEIVQKVVEEYREKGFNQFVFNGFPRTVGQVNSIDEWIKKWNKEGVVARADFISFHVSDETIRERAARRREEYQNQGRELRKDDLPEAVEERRKVFKKHIEPMLASLASEGRLIIINGERDIQKVRELTEDVLDTRYINPEKRF